MYDGRQDFREITCPLNHFLVQTRDLCQLRGDKIYSNNIYCCDTCRKEFSSKEVPCHHCRTCIFDLCPSCYEAQKLVQINCPQNHPLLKVRALQLFSKYPNNTYKCNSCMLLFDSFVHTSAHCRVCQYDLCPSCLGTIQSMNFQPPYQQQEPVKRSENLLATKTRRIMCINNHILNPVNNLRQLHPNSGGSYDTNEYFCDTCEGRFRCQIEKSYHCKTCKFDLCPSCYQKNQKVNFDCPVGHPLYLVSSLRYFNRKTNTYIYNAYICNSCRAQYDAGVNRSCHCQQCEYDLCPLCFEIKKREIKSEDEGIESYPEEIVKRLEELEINNVEPERKHLAKKESEKKEVQNEMICVVCLDAQRSHLFTPCMHICTCAKCSSEIVSKQSRCPICRNPIQSSVKVYMS